MSKKKVLLLADPLDDQSAGIHRVVKEVLYEISQSTHQNLEFIVFRQRKDKALNLPQITFPKPKIPGLAFIRLFLVIPFIRWLKKADVVVEFAHFGPFNLPKNTKRVTYIHDLTPILFPKFHVFNGWFLHEMFLGRIIKNADLIFADSKNTAKDLFKWYPLAKNKTKVNYLGVSKHFRPLSDQQLLVKNDIDRPYFMHVGTIEPRKGIDVLLEAFEIFKKDDRQDHYLLIIGKMGWRMEDINEQIGRHPYKNWIKYLGFVSQDELTSFYSMAKFLIMPSRYEGFGLPIIEAMYCGTRSIVARNSSLEEIGEICDAIFFQTDRPIELAKKMKCDPAFTLKTDIRFDWKSHVNRFVENINRLVT